MKENIHPTYYPDAEVICACGNTWHTGSTKKTIRTDVCFKCHPFYTGEQRIVDTEGQVDRFYRKLQARQEIKEATNARQTARTSPQRPVEELELSNRITDTLLKAGITNAGQILERLAQGDDELLKVDGFGRKALADTKKKLRLFGYELPQSEEAVA